VMERVIEWQNRPLALLVSIVVLNGGAVSAIMVFITHLVLT
jgi:hypothetical protein